MCVILYTEIDGKQILAKNRDRAYKPEIEIVHEIVNGIEIVYIRDKITGWIEGMNENGVGLVNSTLSNKDGGKITDKKIKATEKKKNVIYKALCEKDNGTNFFNFIKNADTDYVLEGNTLVYHNGDILHIENNKKNDYVIKKINKPNVVFSNHGTILKENGYTNGMKGLSSFLRKKIIESELERHKITSIDQIADIMNRNYKNIDPRFHPYRDKRVTLKRVKGLNKRQNYVNTTGQLVLNMTDKEFIYYTDVNSSLKTIYVNKLPRDYTPKIRVTIKKTEKNIKPTKILTQKYIHDLEDKFLIDEDKKSIKNTTDRSTKKNTKLEKNKTRRKR
jgi:hypothetical protein